MDIDANLELQQNCRFEATAYQRFAAPEARRCAPLMFV